MATETDTEDLDIEVVDAPEKDADGEEMVEVELDESVEGTGVDAEPDFWANLAEDGVLDEREVMDLVSELCDLTDEDKTAHKKRADDYADALKRSGLDGEPTGGAEFEGAAKVVHPMIIEAAVDFESMAIRELMPIGGQEGGPVKHHVIGKATQSKLDRAHRKSQHMNWQLTEQMPSFRDTMEVLLTQLPMAGNQYLKLYYNKGRRRPEELFVPRDEIWLPSSVSSFTDTHRFTHAQTITKLELEKRIASGMYREVNLGETVVEPEKTSAQEASDKIAGKTSSGTNEDNSRLVREIYVFLSIESDPETKGALAPYIVSIDDETETLLSIYRDWMPDDPRNEQLVHIIEFPFIPWRGGPIGLAQLIGGLSIAATGALRALLDSAHLNNLQAAVKLKGGSTGGQNVDVVPGQIVEIEGAVGIDDIRKTVMPLPFNPPSPTLFQLLGFLTEAGGGVVNVALEKLADAKSDMPVGTTMALIEQGAKVYAAIHSRLHRAMARTLKALHQINRLYLDEEALEHEAGEILAKRADYEGAMDVVPVSDPNIFSETQRFAQIQAVAARATGNPLYDARKVEELILDRLKIPNGKDLLVPKPEPKRLNPVNENIAAAMGQPVIAFPDQDHIAHLRTHLDFLMNEMFGQNPLVQPILLPVLLPHLKDHIVYAYAAAVEASATSYAGRKVSELMDDDDEVSNEMDRLLADASAIYLDDARALLDETMPPPALPPRPDDPEALKAAQPSPLLAFLGQMQQMLQQMQPPPPQDPAAVAAQDVQRKSAADQAKTQVDQAKIQNDAKKLQLGEQELALKQQAEATDRMQEERLQQRALDVDLAINTADNQTATAINTADNMTALTIAEAEIEQGNKSDLSTGGGIDPGNA